MEIYGHKIRMARTRAGIRSSGLAKLLGWSGTKMSFIESGARQVTLEDAVRIANALGLDIKQLCNIKPNSLCERIADFRIKRGWDQKELASRLGVVPPQVSKWESGRAEPSAKNVLRLSKLFEVPIGILMDGVDSESDYLSKGDGPVTISNLAAKLAEADRKHPGMAEGFLLLLEEGLLDTREDAQDLISLVRIMQRRASRGVG